MIETTLTQLAITVFVLTLLAIGASSLLSTISQRIHRARMSRIAITCRVCGHCWQPEPRDKHPHCPHCGRPNTRIDRRLN